MGNNVNTLPSSDVDSFSIRWITFATRDKENVIDAKKMVKGRDAYIPEVGKVQSTYIIEKNNIWMRCIKAANKLRRINGANIKSDEKIKRLETRMNKKYAQKNQMVNR